MENWASGALGLIASQPAMSAAFETGPESALSQSTAEPFAVPVHRFWRVGAVLHAKVNPARLHLTFLSLPCMCASTHRIITDVKTQAKHESPWNLSMFQKYNWDIFIYFFSDFQTSWRPASTTLTQLGTGCSAAALCTSATWLFSTSPALPRTARGLSRPPRAHTCRSQRVGMTEFQVINPHTAFSFMNNFQAGNISRDRSSDRASANMPPDFFPDAISLASGSSNSYSDLWHKKREISSLLHDIIK